MQYIIETVATFLDAHSPHGELIDHEATMDTFVKAFNEVDLKAVDEAAATAKMAAGNHKSGKRTKCSAFAPRCFPRTQTCKQSLR